MRRHEARQRFEQSKLLFSQKRYPEAMIVLDELNAAFPNEKHVMYARAMCLAELQRPQEAIQICEQAVAMHNDPKSQELLGRLRREHGPIQEGPTDLASLVGRGAGPGGLAGMSGIPDIPSMPDMPAYTAAPQQASSKRFYIIVAAVAGILLAVLIGLPFAVKMTKGDDASGTQPVAVSEESGVSEGAIPPSYAETAPSTATEAPATASSGVVQPVQWYYDYDQGMNVAFEYSRPICIFFYDGGAESARIEETLFQNPGISQTLSQFINIRVLYADDDYAVRTYRIEAIPTVVVLDTFRQELYRASGGEITASDLQAALGLVQVEQAATQIARTGEGPSMIVFVVFLLASLFLAPWPLYLTLLFTGKLPHGEFLKDFFSVALVAIGANAIAGIVPCFGIIVLIWILHSVYDMGLIDFIIYFAISAVVSVLMALGAIAIFGMAFLDALPMVPAG